MFSRFCKWLQEGSKPVIFTGVFCFFLASSLDGQLHFSEDQKEVTLELGQLEALVIYPFVNKGSETVRITAVNSDCGCTAAVPEKREYAPGEEGQIEVRFTVGSRSGQSMQRVHLRTNHPDANRHTLVTRFYIPEEIKVSERVLLWKDDGSERLPLTFTVKIHPESPLEFQGFATAKEDVTISLEQIRSTEHRAWEVTVKPPPGEAPIRFRMNPVFTEESLQGREPPGVNVFGLVR